MQNLDQYLKQESTLFNQEEEVERILKYKDTKDPFLILELPLECYISLQINESIIKKTFRQKSLLIHPDKNKHPQARLAFEELQKAQAILLDSSKRKVVLEYLKEARDAIFHKQGIEFDGDSASLLEKYPKIGRLIQLEVIRLTNELEYREYVRVKNEKGREEQRQQWESSVRKEREEFEKKWEETRGDRIQSWQKFSKGVKKKTKKDVLGSLPKGIKK